MMWFWIALMVLVCVVVGGYVYVAEYRESGSDDHPYPFSPAMDENQTAN